MTIQTYIYLGRFQPFHADHLNIVQQFIIKHPTSHLVLAAVRGVPESELIADEYQALSSEHFRPERNPFGAVTTLRMLDAVARARLDGHAVVTLIPRPSRGRTWQVICSLLPGPRTWIVPDRGEPWDNTKAQFFAGMGDAVLRMTLRRSISGRTIRDLLSRDEYDKALATVPAEVATILESVR